MANLLPTRSKLRCSTSHLAGFSTSSKNQKENESEKQTQLARSRSARRASDRARGVVERSAGARPHPLESAREDRWLVLETVHVVPATHQSRNNFAPPYSASVRSEIGARDWRAR